LVIKGYDIRAETPSVAVYRHLRSAAGLSRKSEAAAQAGLPNTWFGVVVYAGDEPVGMGRVIGDGGTVFQIVDIAVHPDHQGRGLGKSIMAELTRELSERAPATALVSLFADGAAKHLYEQFGFTETAPASIGMARRY
jgi:ribosomal protein S18 acetylase RimI-like enzyme